MKIAFYRKGFLLYTDGRMVRRGLLYLEGRSCSVFLPQAEENMGRLRGDHGRAEDLSLPTAGRKGLAEAGPPGKRPHGNESARSSLQYFIFKVAKR
jgi:hypothetical protein